MLPYFNFFGLSFPVPELVTLFGVYFGLVMVEKFAGHYGQKGETIYELGFYSIIAGIIGARLAYAAEHYVAFTQNPRSLLSLNIDLFDFWGGFAVAILTGLIYGQRKKLAFWSVLDALTPAFALFGAVLPIANLASGNAYGAPSTLPWAIELWGTLRHPTQIYEALGAGIILYILWPIRRQEKQKAGSDFLKFIMLSAGARLFFEAFRGNSVTFVFNIRSIQLAAWILLAFAIWGYAKIHQSSEPHEV